jgi:ribosomal protein S18 acetylase RimI-like enzyme
VVIIRPYAPGDFDAVTRLWRAAREKAFPVFQKEKGHTFEEDCDYFRNVISKKNDIWVADMTNHVTGFLAMAGDFVDQLYVHPDSQRRGVGTALLDHARSISRDHVWLYTFQSNTDGRAFYEKNGFIAVRFGISPQPESEPHVEYHWRPRGLSERGPAPG